MSEELKEDIREAAARKVAMYPRTYADYGVDASEVAGFFLKAAELFEKAGWDNRTIMCKITSSMGNYLLGRKYGVTPEGYARYCINERAIKSGKR